MSEQGEMLICRNFDYALDGLVEWALQFQGFWSVVRFQLFGRMPGINKSCILGDSQFISCSQSLAYHSKAESKSVAITETIDGTVSICTVRGNMTCLQAVFSKGNSSRTRFSIRTAAHAYLNELSLQS